MGVPQIWELLQPFIKDKRVPLRKFASDFKKKTGRSVRIAIDGYTWAFECGFLTNSGSPEKFHGHAKTSKAIVNLLHRLKEFLSLDISFILVFDGNMKPWFKKNFAGRPTSISQQLEADYFTEWESHKRCHKECNRCLGQEPVDDHGPEFMTLIKKLLDMIDISYIEACGEGEAQCSWLQKHGYVDYVLSNDSDTLIFGCDRMLRNYSKSIDDLGVTGAGTQRPTASRDASESFVTVVELDAIRQSTAERYEWWSLLFFSVLLGADYNQGVKGLGKTKSAVLAQLRDPDFAMQFRSIFQNVEHNASLRTSRYLKFQEDLLNYCSLNSVKLFGRSYKALVNREKMEGWPSETAVMFYFHPYLIPNLNISIFEKTHTNMSGSTSYRNFDLEKLQNFLREINPFGVTHFDRWFQGLTQESFILKYILQNDSDLEAKVEITDEKIFFPNEPKFSYSSWRVRYNKILPGTGNVKENSTSGAMRQGSQTSTNNSKYEYSIWIPKGLLPESHSLVRRFKETRSLKSKNSLKKPIKYSPQKNTLDVFLSNHSSPVKDTDSLESVRIPVLEPLKKRLFVETDQEADSDSELDGNDSSLIILAESKVADSQISHVFTVDDESDQSSDDESPLKKQRLERKRSKRP